MALRNAFAILWLLLGLGWGFWVQLHIGQRFGQHRLGRFMANWAGFTLLFLGLGGWAVFWNGGVTEAGWRRGQWVDSHRWTWPGALLFAGIAGLVAGLLATWHRSKASYHLRPSSEPLMDQEEIQELLSAEANGTPKDGRALAEVLVADSRALRQPLPPQLRAFVDRQLPGVRRGKRIE